jgi:cell division protein FtsL
MIELVFSLLLVVTFLVIGWFSLYVVYNLYRGQR